VGDVRLRALGADEVKGLPQPVEAWQCAARRPVSAASRRGARAAVPLVGRQEEIDLLLRRWDQAKRGEGRVVLLSANLASAIAHR